MSIFELFSLKFPGDDKAKNYRDDFLKIVMRIDPPCPPQQYESALRRGVSQSEGFKLFFHGYMGLPEAQRTYEKLLATFNRWLDSKP